MMFLLEFREYRLKIDDSIKIKKIDFILKCNHDSILYCNDKDYIE